MKPSRNLASSQFKFVTLEADGQVDLADSAGENCIGVVINDPASGGEATVVVSGKTVVTSGGTIAAGAAIATDASGDAVTAASTNIIMGYALEAAVDGQIMAIELIQGGNVVA